MGRQIIYSDILVDKLDSMIFIMFEKGHFYSLEASEKYVQRIYDFIETIHKQPLKLCKTQKYGKYYAKYDNAKSKMSYYITFNLSKDRFYIKDIISPKTKAYLAIRGLK